MKFKKNVIYCDDRIVYYIKQINNNYITWENIYPNQGDTHGYKNDDAFFSLSYEVDDNLTYCHCFNIIFKDKK